VMSYNRPNSTTTLGSVDAEASRFYYGATDVSYSWNAATLTLTQYGTQGADILLGTELDDRFEGVGGADEIYGGGGRDWIYGEYGNDVLTGGAGNDTLDGAWDLDTARFSGMRANYTLASIPTGIEVRDNVSGRDGIDTLAGIERLQFSDGVLAFDASGNAGQVYRLYQAAFARTPDNAGLKHNIGLIDDGLTLQQMSSAFLASAEFQQRYGVNVTDTDYINALYQNVLQRNAEPAGLAGWTALLNEGFWNRTTLLIGFSESPENIANVAPVIGTGIWLV
jgi:Ca2+-binding RTX toxin-like protein